MNEFDVAPSKKIYVAERTKTNYAEKLFKYISMQALLYLNVHVCI